MTVRQYFPSAQFSLTVVSLTLAAGAIYAATQYNHPHSGTAELSSVSGTGTPTIQHTQAVDWQAALASSATQSNSTATGQTDDLVKGSQSKSLTESLGRALLINTSAAAGEGLGGDQPTQDRILATSLSQVTGVLPKPTLYQAAEVTVLPDSTLALYTYGNALATAIGSVPQSTFAQTMLAVGFAVDSNDAAALAKLSTIAKGYRSLAEAVIHLPAPASLKNLALQAANNYVLMASACDDMTTTLSDPARGLAGIQTYNTLVIQNTQVFTQIAQTFQNNAILFSTTDAGKVWSLFLAAEQRAALQPAPPSRSSQ